MQNIFQLIDPSSRKPNLSAILKYMFPNFVITCILCSLHFASSVLFVKYGNEILHNDDRYLPYLHVVCSWLAIYDCLPQVLLLRFTFTRKRKKILMLLKLLIILLHQ